MSSMDMNGITQNVKSFWNSIDIDAWLSRLGITYSLPVQTALCFGSGFAIGFLFKRYFKFFIAMLFAAAILIKILEYNSILLIDWQAFRMFMGFDPHAGMNDMINEVFDWIKDQIVIVVASIVGFAFGYRLGS